ncbi:MAG: helix-turn-helix domain-containing protein [Brevundimonas sp.]
MQGLIERPGTVIPSEYDADLAATASRALARASKDSLHVRLEGGEELTLPKAVTRLLSHLLMEMGQGNAVTIIPIHAELTTQEAADFLNVSRPHLVKMLNEGKIVHHRVGTHRRVRFEDVCAYKDAFEKERRAKMEALAQEAQDLGMGY